MEDYEMLRKVWDGGVPVEFRLDNEDVMTNVEVSHYEILPRISYFYLELESALKFFSNAIDNLGDVANLWLESNGTLLKWHYPIGVLFDLHSSADEYPWVITIHLKKFPENLVRFANRDEKRNCFLQAIKEADQLKNKGRVVSEMKPDEHNKLFDSLCNKKFEDFRSTNVKLRQVVNVSHLPIRFYKVGAKSFQQILISPRNGDESAELTLNDAVQLAFPDDTFDSFEFVTYGILLPKETPLNYLVRNLSYADNFVHIIIKGN